MTRLMHWCDQRLSVIPAPLLNGFAITFTILLIGIDLLTRPFISLILFYALCIGLCAWYASIRWAYICGALSTVGWIGNLVVDTSTPILTLWNALIRAITIAFFLYLLVRLRTSLAHAEYLAQHDPLTNALNVRAFRTQLHLRQQQALQGGYPLTLAYLDLDNFKLINDQHGHAVGDQVLITLVATMQAELCARDVLARIGGDEFVLLLPDVTATQARQIIGRLRDIVTAVFRRHNWPVTPSIGVVTFLALPYTADEMLRVADQVLYDVKQSGKDAARFAIYPAAG